jgi:hypothetical protein
VVSARVRLLERLHVWKVVSARVLSYMGPGGGWCLRMCYPTWGRVVSTHVLSVSCMGPGGVYTCAGRGWCLHMCYHAWVEGGVCMCAILHGWRVVSARVLDYNPAWV